MEGVEVAGSLGVTYKLLMMEGVEMAGGGLCGAHSPVCVIQPLLQQWLQLAHVLEGEVQSFKPMQKLMVG